MPSNASESVRKRRAVSSNSIRSARSSVVRDTREMSETMTMPAMNSPEMAIPSGFSMTFSTSAYNSTSVRTANAAVARRWLRRAAETVTATAPDTIMTRIPVA